MENTIKADIVDEDGNIHHVIVKQRRESGLYYVIEYYSDGSYNTSQDCVTPDKAIKDHTTSTINANCAQRFEDELSEEEKARMLSFIHTRFQPGIRGNAKAYSSYYLKHVVERGIGKYVSNGQLKGAMKKAEIPIHKTSQPADINYTYILRKL